MTNPEGHIGHHAIRGGAAALAGQSLTFLLRTGSAVVLARLLTPTDFGLIAMVLAFSSFLTPFRDFGLSTATIQRKSVTHGELSNLFWVNAGAGATLTLVMAAISPLLARFYHEPLLVAIGLALSARYLLEGIAIQHQALLRRQMRFEVLSALDAVGLALGAGLAIFGAWRGWSYWALVVQQLVPPAIVAIGVWLVHGWRPHLPSRQHDVRSQVLFGGQLTGANILASIAGHFDSVLVGWRWGSLPLGLYSRAYTLLLLPLQQITQPLDNVAIASLSRLQDDPERYRKFYCASVTVLTFATTPLLAVLAALSEDIIAVVLGDQWLAASQVFTVLAIAQLGQPVAGTINWVYESLGQSNRMLRWAMLTTPLSMASFAIGLPWGPVGVATAYAVQVHLVRFPALWYAFRYSPVKTRDWIIAAWRPAVVSALTWISLVLSRNELAGWHPMGRLTVCCLVGAGVMAASTLLWPETRRQIIALTRQMIALFRARSAESL